MKVFMLMTGSGPLVILTSHQSIVDAALLDKLAAKGMTKFIAYEIALDLARTRYAGHFDVASRDLHESDDLPALDYNGERAFRLFRFDELGPELRHEGA